MTYTQRSRKPRKIYKPKRTEPRIIGKPFRTALCLGVKTLSPKKPNSANRSIALIRFSGGSKSIAAIPGIGHTVQQYNSLLIRGGRSKDLPGIKLKVLRGSLDSKPVKNRVSSRSKYGVPNPNPDVEKSIVYLREKNKLAQIS